MAVIVSADDDQIFRELIARILDRAGHRVIPVADGQAALDATFEHGPDLVILDVDMPRVHGLRVCRVLRDDPRTAHIPVLIASGAIEPPYKEVKAAGATGYVPKPFSSEALRDAVEEQLSVPII